MDEEKILDSYDDVKIVMRKSNGLPVYQIIEPEFSESELGIIKNPKSLGLVFEDMEKTLSKLNDISEKEDYLTIC